MKSQENDVTTIVIKLRRTSENVVKKTCKNCNGSKDFYSRNCLSIINLSFYLNFMGIHVIFVCTYTTIITSGFFFLNERSDITKSIPLS